MKRTTSCAIEKRSALSAIAALADEHRYDAFMVLLNVGAGGLDASEIAERSHAEKTRHDNALLSKDLAILVRSKLVRAERTDRTTLYHANEGVYASLITFLRDVLISKF